MKIPARMTTGIILLIFLFTTPVYSEPPKAVSEGGKFYLDFKATKLINALIVLSQITGINFVAGKEVVDREVNMVLDNVSLQDALEAIARGSNVSYDFIPDRNIYLFRAGADAESSPPLRTRVFRLYYVLVSPVREIEASASSSGSQQASNFSGLKEADDTEKSKSSQIVTIIESMLSERGKVKIDDRSNSLIVTDMEDRLQMIEQVIAQLDQRLDQVLIEVILIETSEDFDRYFGIEWSNEKEGTLGVIQGGIA